MARIRYIKPGFFANEELADCTPLTRLLFVSLWTLADREGRLEDRPKRIKVQALPHDDCEVDAMLQDLHVAGLICRYQNSDGKFIQINNFRKHQHPHKSEPDSTIAPPEKTIARRKKPARNDSRPAVNYELLTGNGELLTLLPESESSEAFDKFYTAYPRKVDKRKAEKSWKALKPTAELAAKILDAVERHKSTIWLEKELNYVPYPASWLNGRRWEDETLTVEHRPKPATGTAAWLEMLEKAEASA